MGESIHLLELIGTEKLDQILQGFTAVTGVASIIADPHGFPMTKPHNFSLLCSQYCRSTPEGRLRCHQSDQFGGIQSARSCTPPIYSCLNAGLLDCAAPVIVGGSHVATVLCGQVLEEPLNEDEAVTRARSIGVADLDGYLHQLAKVPLMSRDRLLRVANLMSVITKTISELALGAYRLKLQSEEYLNQVINAVSDCIISTDSKGIISMINEAGAGMFGASAKELIGQPMEKLFSGRDRRAVFPVPPLNEATRSQRCETIAVRRNSGEFPVQVSVSEIRDTRDGIPDFVAVVRDISEEKRIDRLKEDLIGMVMHDIRSPALSLQKAMQLMADQAIGSLNMNQLDIVRLALGTSHQLYAMASNLLDIYRNENGQLQLVKSPIDLGQIIRDAVSQLEFFARDRRVTIVFESPENCVRLFGDQKRLLRVIVNLLDNAVKYSPEDGEVRVTSRRIPAHGTLDGDPHLPRSPDSGLQNDEELILATVRDEGLGIPPRYHQVVFDKFFTVESRDLPERKGVGLGLAFCRQVVEAHGGCIWVRSPLSGPEREQGHGCELSFLLPLGDARSSALPAARRLQEG